MRKYACTRAELSCIIGNLFTELNPPCDNCGADHVTIHGVTVTGNAATLIITTAGFDFDGSPADAETIEHIRKGRNTARPRPYTARSFFNARV